MILPVKSKWIHLLFFNSASVMLDTSVALLSRFTHLLMAVSALFPVIFILYAELTFKNINQPCHSLPKTRQWLNILLIIKSNLLTLAYKPLMAWPPLQSLLLPLFPLPSALEPHDFLFQEQESSFPPQGLGTSSSLCLHCASPGSSASTSQHPRGLS